MQKVTIIMYHYVRDLLHSYYPDIKACNLHDFKEQISYLEKHYNFITMEELIFAIEDNYQLPPKAVLLTFDDAYSDHFQNVFPILNQKNIQGSFFPPVKAITEHTILGANKIHFILAKQPDISKIIKSIFFQLDHYREQYQLESNEFYLHKLAQHHRYDSQEIIFIKRLLQIELKEKIRKIITDNLFQEIVGCPENIFSRELYMSLDQIKCMKNNGMHIGSHGYDHYWFGSLSIEEQAFEIKKSIEFIQEIGGDINNWTMCYPYGDFNKDTLKLLAANCCKLGLTTQVDVFTIEENKNSERRFIVPRLDTNDIPKQANADTNQWYEQG